MKNIEAVLFDVDGTLLDTREFIYQAYENTLRVHGIAEISREIIAISMGKSLSECYQDFAPGLDHQVLCEAHRSFQEINLHLSIPFPNTLTTLKRLKSRGVKMATITSRSLRTSAQTLELAGIYHFFDIVITPEDVKLTKPNPEGLFKALDVLGVKSENAVMIGDTDADVLAGKAAGTKTIGVTYGFHGQRILETNPDFVVNDISEIIPLIA